MLRHCIFAARGEQFSGAAMLMDAGKRSELPTEVLGKRSHLRTWLTTCTPIPHTEQQLAMLSKPAIVRRGLRFALMHEPTSDNVSAV
jgi:hypothetical protein